MRSLHSPQLFIDVDRDSVRLIDPGSGAVRAAASASLVTATPVTYELAWHASDAAGECFSTMPVLPLSVPGMPLLSVGCRHFDKLTRRFSWSANVPVTNDPPAYVVSPADWLTLAESCGLAAHLGDSAKQG